MNSDRPTDSASSSGTELIALVTLGIRNSRLLLGLPLLFALLTVGIFLVLPKKYTSTVSFVPAGPELPGGALSALAGQVGVSLGTDPAASPDYFVSILGTREMLQPLVERKYEYTSVDGPAQATLIELMEISGSDSGRTIAAALKTLQENVLDIAVNRRSGVITVDARTKWPDVSYALASALIVQLDSFMYEMRQRRGEAESRFLSERLNGARLELTQAEATLSTFLARNRSYQSDPVLVAEQERLRRDIQLKVDVFSLLTQGYEQARTTAQRNTPSINVVQPARLPLRFDRRGLAQKALAGAFIGALVSLLLLGAAAAVEQARASAPQAFDEMLLTLPSRLSRLVPRSKAGSPGSDL